MTPHRFSITPLGDAAVLVTAEGDPRAARDAVRAWSASLQADPLPGVRDIVPAFATLGVSFDPPRVTASGQASPSATVVQWLTEQCQATDRALDAPAPNLVEIPVLYGGEHGSDLAEVASHASLSVAELIRCHSEAEYRVAAIGFAPGFAYLEGLPAVLHTPRRATPRTQVPRGTVAIGGPYCGVYPQASPGGWNLMGRTSTRLFDLHREPPSLLRVGDRVRFRPVDRLEHEEQADTAKTPLHDADTGVLRVVSAGVQSTLQDLGRAGSQAIGVSPSGAMDCQALQLANLLAGNPRDAVAVEATLVGPVLEAVRSVVIGVAGALPAGFDSPRRLHLAAGEQLDLRSLSHGARCYVATTGGFASDRVLGGHGVDLGAGFGGSGGRALAAGDVLSVAGGTPRPTRVSAALPRVASPCVGGRSDGPHRLRVLAGPHAELLAEKTIRRFFDAEYTISPQSNRMGLRCEEGDLLGHSLDLESQPVAGGVVQLPPDGRPVILAADRQTLGGYPIIACVVTADLPLVGQLAPGDRVRFCRVEVGEAEQLRRESDRWLGLAAAGIATQDGQL